MGINSGGWKEIMPIVNKENIKHVSFDFWNTLAHPNPVFKVKRAERVADWLNKQISTSEINAAFSLVGREYNSYQESGQPTVSPIFLLNSVIGKLAPNTTSCINELYLDINAIFLEYPPAIESSCYDIIGHLNKKGKTCSITSNTAFIMGSVIVEYLEKCNLLNHFSFTIFSDEFGFGKPCSKIFNHLINKTVECKSPIDSSNILHIGDSLETDINGAIQSRLTAFHLLDNNLLKSCRNSLYVINDINKLPFLPEDYSKFKFGSYTLAKKFGLDLFEYFKNFHLDKLISSHKKIIVYSSPYMHLPTSSFYLTQTFYEALKQHLASQKMEFVSLELGKIERCQTYTVDYGALKADERFNLIKNDTYKLTNIPEKNDLCIFIDDISITGTHQRVVEQLLESSSVSAKSFFLYFAKLCNSDVCPSFENHLNYAFINDFNKVIDLITSDDYRITTRTTKYILSQKSDGIHQLINALIKKEKFGVWHELVKMSYKNGYHKIDIYQQNLIDLEVALKGAPNSI